MKVLKVIIPCLLITNFVFCQKLEYDIKEKKLNYFLTIEEELGSKLIPNTSEYWSKKGIAQPIQYEREQTEITNLIVQYFFYEKDSTIAYILYEWDVRNFNESSNNKQSSDFQKRMIEQYNKLDNEIISQLGEATKITGSLENFSKVEERGGLKKKKIWKQGDNFEIEMYIGLSNYYLEQGKMKIPTFHRIRLYVRNVKDSEKNKLTENKILEFNKLTNEFINHLKTKDYKLSKKILAPMIQGKTTTKQLKETAKLLRKDDEIKLYNYGVVLGKNGEQYFVIQYKYSSDKSTPPTELIKVIFDSNNKIVEFRPVKLVKQK